LVVERRAAVTIPEERAVGTLPSVLDWRLPVTLVGYGMAAFSILLAWLWGAGVQTSPVDFSSGPPLSTLLLLSASIGLLALGSAIVAVFGSTYGHVVGLVIARTVSGTARPTRNVPRLAVFCFVLGIGLLLMGLLMPVANLGFSSEPLYLSPTVLFVPATVDGAALGVLALGIALLRVGRTRYPTESRAWWRRTGRYAAVAGVVVFLLVAALLTAPVHQSFSTQLDVFSGEGGGIAVESLPQGTHVTGSWTSNPAGLVNFTIQDTSGVTIYAVNASSGTFSFTAEGVPYTWYTFQGTASFNGTVTITGAFNAPMWSWPPGEPGNPT